MWCGLIRFGWCGLFGGCGWCGFGVVWIGGLCVGLGWLVWIDWMYWVGLFGGWYGIYSCLCGLCLEGFGCYYRVLFCWCMFIGDRIQ